MIWENLWCQVFEYVFIPYFRPMLKWLLRKVTGKCELLRITYGEQPGARQATKIELSLKRSKHEALKRLLVDDNVDIEEAVSNIMKIKSVNSDVHSQFGRCLTCCLCQICGYRQLVAQVDHIRRTKYNSENPAHEALLMQLWDRLQPDIPLKGRITKQWGEIGFQGDDPSTDFRGMGLLGLQNLVFLATRHTEVARRLLSHSSHPQYGYSLAIVGINLTGLAFQLLSSGALKTHFYNLVHGAPTLEQFHQLYCFLFYEFDKLWMQEKPNIMEFNRVKEKFQKRILHLLKDKSCVFRAHFASRSTRV